MLLNKIIYRRCFIPVLPLVLTLLLSVPSLFAQSVPERIDKVDPLFQEALKQFENGDFAEAAAGFDRILREFPLNQRTTAAHLMKGKSQLRMGESLEAARTLRGFLSAYPGSSYRADASYNLGLAFLSTERFDAAVSTFLAAWEELGKSGGKDALEASLVNVLDAVIDSTYNVIRIRNHFQDVGGRTQRAYLWLKTAEKRVAGAEITLAEAALDSVEQRYPTPLLQARAAALRTSVRQRSDVRIAVMLPLMRNSTSGSVREIGEDLLAGITQAVDAHNALPGVRVHVTLDVRDTERDPLVATRIAQEVTSDQNVVAIIGPVFSNTTSAVVGLTNARKIPLVSPTANSNGLAAVGPYVFQANPDYENRGKAMARYAVQKRGHRRLAMLAPIDTYAKFMAEAFMAEAVRLGAEMVGTEWYQRGETDFTMQLRNIRKAAMMAASAPMLSFDGALTRQEIMKLVHLGIPIRKVDSLLERSAVVDAATLLGPDAARILDSVGVRVTSELERLDSLEYPAKGIDGFYVPVSMPEEIGLVSSQIVYFNFATELLGSGEWNSFAELDANKRYCRNVAFDADSYAEQEYPPYITFTDTFFDRYKRRPSTYALFGYDTAHLLLSLIESGASQRESLRSALASTRSYRGLHSRIGFTESRVNTWIHILQFDGERIHRVDEFSVE